MLLGSVYLCNVLFASSTLLISSVCWLGIFLNSYIAHSESEKMTIFGVSFELKFVAHWIASFTAIYSTV